MVPQKQYASFLGYFREINKTDRAGSRNKMIWKVHISIKTNKRDCTLMVLAFVPSPGLTHFAMG